MPPASPAKTSPPRGVGAKLLCAVGGAPALDNSCAARAGAGRGAARGPGGGALRSAGAGLEPERGAENFAKARPQIPGTVSRMLIIRTQHVLQQQQIHQQHVHHGEARCHWTHHRPRSASFLHFGHPHSALFTRAVHEIRGVLAQPAPYRLS